MIVGFSGFWFRVPLAKPESRLPNPAEERRPTCRLGRLADLVKSPRRPVAKSPRRGTTSECRPRRAARRHSSRTRKTAGDSWKRQEEVKRRQRPSLIPSNLRENVRNVGLVESRECETPLSEVVERRPYVDQDRPVDDEEAVVELVGNLDDKRIRVLGVEPGDVNGERRSIASDLPLDVAICDLQSSSSSFVNWNMNESGKRLMLRLTCSFSRRVGTCQFQARKSGGDRGSGAPRPLRVSGAAGETRIPAPESRRGAATDLSTRATCRLGQVNGSSSFQVITMFPLSN